eukprot:8734470-Alexandrium_andersonii.AAC.1
MSASLVGSEMCIRDRPRPGTGLARRPCPRRPDCQRGPTPGRPEAGGQAVSYTHLTLPTICSV